MTGYGTVTPELEAWMEAHRDLKWKHKPYVAPKPSKLSAPRDAVFKEHAIDYKFHRHNDFRVIREPVSLEEFIARKSDPKWKMPAFKMGRMHSATHYPADQVTAAIRWATDLIHRHTEALKAAA